jgi:hypothetical protein
MPTDVVEALLIVSIPSRNRIGLEPLRQSRGLEVPSPSIDQGSSEHPDSEYSER